jgi:hypothetical protein
MQGALGTLFPAELGYSADQLYGRSIGNNDMYIVGLFPCNIGGFPAAYTWKGACQTVPLCFWPYVDQVDIDSASAYSVYTSTVGLPH